MATMFSPDEIESMTVSAWERAKAAVAAGDSDRAVALIDEAAARTRDLQIYSIEWITSLLSFVSRELGEPAVERALRATSDDFIHARRTGKWGDLPATVRAKVIARAMFGERRRVSRSTRTTRRSSCRSAAVAAAG